MPEGYIPAPNRTGNFVRQRQDAGSSIYENDHTPVTGLEVKLLTLAMQEIILAESNARGWKNATILSRTDDCTITFFVYKDGIKVEADLDVRILRQVLERNLKLVLMDHAKGLLDMIHGRSELNALQKRRIEREEIKALAAKGYNGRDTAEGHQR